jgi:hypothetical protein
MTEQLKVNYSDVIERGFKTKHVSDTAFFNENGYQWMIVTKRLTKRIHIDWDCETHFLTLIRADKDDNIKGRIFLTGDLEELDRVIRFFTGNEPDKNEL